MLPSESLNDEKDPALIRTGGACGAGDVEAEGAAGTEGVLGVVGTAGGVGVVGAGGADGVEETPEEIGVTFADSHPENAIMANPPRKILSDSWLKDFEIFIRSFFIPSICQTCAYRITSSKK